MVTNRSIIPVLIKIASFGIDLHTTNYVDCRDNPRRVASNIYTLTSELLDVVMSIEISGKLSLEDQAIISDANQFLIAIAKDLPSDIGVALGMAIIIRSPNPFEAANDNNVH